MDFPNFRLPLSQLSFLLVPPDADFFLWCKNLSEHKFHFDLVLVLVGLAVSSLIITEINTVHQK